MVYPFVTPRCTSLNQVVPWTRESVFVDTTYAMVYISGVFISQVLDPNGNIKQYPRGKELGLLSFEVCHKRHCTKIHKKPLK